MMHANDGQVTPKTQPSLEESADTKAANSRYIIENWHADKYGLTDSLVRFYVSFGVVPYVLEGCA